MTRAGTLLIRRCAAGRAAAAGRAFTIVELVVVTALIALLLLIGVPSIAALSADARQSAAVQSINSALRRAYAAAMADRNMTAVRFLPGAWDQAERKSEAPPVGRQHLVQYRYVSAARQGASGLPVDFSFEERFERVPGSESVILPEDVWVAPLEALEEHSLGGISNFGADFVLRGEVGRFYLNADPSTNGNRFLSADDFLIAIDPDTGIRPWRSAGDLLRMKAYAPSAPAYTGFDNGKETSGSSNPAAVADLYQRYSFSGVATYRREAFLALGNDAMGAARQEWLKGAGKPYPAHRLSGGLVSGAP